MKGWGRGCRDGVLPSLVPGDEVMGYCPHWYQGMKGWGTGPLVPGDKGWGTAPTDTRG